ncbi:chromate transporter [Polynucleobacter kasalickyi]|uniref:Chromate transporter n=1 Tax=Polynucleobacter kasalickyi TaxID=1938817 RepID=A0A1W1Y642_9BURK|nr:chromate transporter [Polynucleobacter kasalickyi]SMC31604.1 chromate transporter [Polynucleobacter kasalickyi]
MQETSLSDSQPTQQHSGNARPESAKALFWALSMLALKGFGGVFPIARQVIVEERKWLTNKEFLEEWAVAQVLPGPNIVNLSVMLGNRWFGGLGAFLAVSGIFFFPSIVLILVAIFFEHIKDLPLVAGALKGMGAVSAGLIAGSSIKLATGLKTHPISLWGALLFSFFAFLGLVIFHLKLIVLLLTLAPICIYLTYLRIRELPGKQADTSSEAQSKHSEHQS